ncbi:helix-turn-helix domain-containing protein [[Kitasatospora] papulosa]|uniref:helix-turn-helix domain-containing protein n=1 Tax=Streptomyces TaxID=1883 RepID=UPI002FF21F76
MADTTTPTDAATRPACAVSWCTRPVVKHPPSGLCDACWEWRRRNGGADPESPTRRRLMPPPADGLCTVVEDGARCSKPHLAKGRCNRHWLREWKHGNFRRARRANGELLALVLAAAHATGDDCVLAPCEHSRPTVRYRDEPMPAARAVWWEATGVDPEDRQVLHTCHRGDDGCISIRHLYLGDHTRNMRDMTEAERQARGEGNGNAELTEPDVREIRRIYAARSMSQRALARRYGVSQGTINQVVTRKTWKHVTD